MTNDANAGGMSDEQLDTTMQQEMVAKITEHLQVQSVDGDHVGTVDHMDGDKYIKLTHKDATDDKHHWIPLEWVRSVDDVAVYLDKDLDTVHSQWMDQSPVQNG